MTLCSTVWYLKRYKVHGTLATVQGLSNLRVEFADDSRLDADHIMVLLVAKVSQCLQDIVQPHQIEHYSSMSGVTIERTSSMHDSKGKILKNS